MVYFCFINNYIELKEFTKLHYKCNVKLRDMHPWRPRGSQSRRDEKFMGKIGTGVKFSSKARRALLALLEKIWDLNPQPIWGSDFSKFPVGSFVTPCI